MYRHFSSKAFLLVFLQNIFLTGYDIDYYNNFHKKTMKT